MSFTTSTLRPEGTLRGFSRHGFVDDVLAQPGEYDLTTSVNWTQVKNSRREAWIEGDRLCCRRTSFF